MDRLMMDLAGESCLTLIQYLLSQIHTFLPVCYEASLTRSNIKPMFQSIYNVGSQVAILVS